MLYQSTRGGMQPVPFKDAVITGLAPDGGLLIPVDIPDVSDRLLDLRNLSFVDLAKEIVGLYATDIEPEILSTLIEEAYANFDTDDVVKIRTLGDLKVLELFHGPTLAFKDVALQLLGRLFQHVLTERGEHLNILGATSGDTGSAAIAGVRGLKDVDIFILYPNGRVSPLQELQMTTVEDTNVHCLAVEGSFDDCQTLMKTIFGDLDFKKSYSLGAVNSVNWARVLAQIVYYAYASLRASDQASFCVPTGNFGNVFAGYVAKRMGLPIKHLILATNENDILSEFFRTGVYQRGEVHYTISPAMDIQVASNFERYLYYHLDGDSSALKTFMNDFMSTGRASVSVLPSADTFLSTAVNTRDTLAGIREVYEQYGYLADPHTAVGLVAAQRFSEASNGVDLFCIATAHPAKFPESVDQVAGEGVARHPSLERLKNLPARKVVIPADVEVIKEQIRTNGR
ncbi:MAG: threonine synthase [Proteobacteria bacterium]|nr:threonine synthase [Pseudomonadota bacterium]